VGEGSAKNKVPVFYAFMVGQNRHIQMTIYFDDEKYLPIAKNIWNSAKENTESKSVKRPNNQIEPDANRNGATFLLCP
jgi:hypothetical protein